MIFSSNLHHPIQNILRNLLSSELFDLSQKIAEVLMEMIEIDKEAKTCCKKPDQWLWKISSLNIAENPAQIEHSSSVDEVIMFFNKKIFKGEVKSYADLHSPSYLPTPTINSAIVDNELSKAKVYQALRFRQLFGHFPKSMELHVKFHWKRGSATNHHYF